MCDIYTIFSALFLLRFIRDRESKRLTAFVLLALETKKRKEEEKKRRKEKQSKTIRHRSRTERYIKERHLIFWTAFVRYWIVRD